MIKESMGDVIYKLSSMKFEDPNKFGQQNIEDKFDKLNDELHNAFRNLTDSL